MKFAAQSERFNAEQRSLLEDEIEADLASSTTSATLPEVPMTMCTNPESASTGNHPIHLGQQFMIAGLPGAQAQIKTALLYGL